MSLTIGRVALPELTTVERSGRSVRMSGALLLNADSLVLGRQLLGMEEAAHPPYSDEPIVPVTWDVDSSLDAFWRPGTVEWAISAEDGQEYGDWVNWSIDLERVSGSPSLESRLTGAVRANDHSIDDSDARGWWALPSTGEFSYGGVAGAAALRAVETGSFVAGTMRIFIPTVALFSATAVRHTAVATHYLGCCMIRDSDDNVVLGRTGVPVSIDNGLVKVTVGAASLSVTAPVNSGGTAGAWGTSHAFALSDGVAGPLTLSDARILANGPEMVTIRVTVQLASIMLGQNMATLDISLRRGDQMARCQFTPPAATALYVQHASDTALTDLTGGRRRTSDDASSNRWVIATPSTFTNQTGGFSLASSAASRSFALGMEFAGSAASGANAAQQLIYQYHAAQYERQRVVNR